MLLTEQEEHDIACEVMKQSHAKKPLKWVEIGDMVLETIVKRGETPAGRSRTATNDNAVKAVEAGKVGAMFRHRMCGRTGMKDFKAENLGHSRARAANEHSMYEYFTDLQRELVDAHVVGVGDAARKIIDPRRIVNMDEVPQTKNARSDAGNATEKVAGGGKSPPP
jgi:hypothetical protein